MEQKHPSNELLISLNDLKILCLKHKRLIILSIVFFSLLATFFSLSKPIEYTVEGSFKEKGKAFSGLGGNFMLAAFMGNSASADSEAMLMMKSRKLLDQAIHDLDLQGQTFPVLKSYFSFPNLQNIKTNLMIQKAYWEDAKAPSLPDFPEPLMKIVNVKYSAETPIMYDLKMLDDEHFHILAGKLKIAEGIFGEPIKIDDTSFTVIKPYEGSLAFQNWKILIWPIKTIAQAMSLKLSFDADRFDKSLIRIKYQDRDRQKAAMVIKKLMSLYQDYLREEQNRIAGEQIQYLEKRQKEMDKTLRDMMDDYALTLATDLSSTGFTDSNKAMEFLAQKQNYYRQKLLDMELEGRRLQKALEEGYAYYDAYTSYGDPNIINHILSQIRSFKQQADSIEIALREDQEKNLQGRMAVFDKQVEQVKHIQECSEETNRVILALDHETLPTIKGILLEDNRYMVKAWYDKLGAAYKTSHQEYEGCKSGFKNYLQALSHFFKVHQKVIEERLAYQQDHSNEFQGIDLNIAKELYIVYSRQFDDVEAQTLQHQFIVEQMKSPDFEISSLSSILADSVSREMIHKTSSLILNLKDENNRSVKEQDRLKEQISLQKEFLSMHLKQTIQLLALRKELLKEKIRALQSVTLGLTHQQISILEKHLTDYFKTRLKDLKQEREIIQAHQGELRAEMAALPSKWVTETLINQQMEMNRRMVEEVSRLVESKNLSNNLEMVQSAPFDVLNIPLHPKAPRVVFYALLGALMGSFFSVTFLVTRAILKGVPASDENLRHSGQTVAGIISSQLEQGNETKLYDSDLQTLRRLTSLIEERKGSNSCETLLCLKGQGVDFTKSLALLLSKKNYKTLIISLEFKQFESSSQEGILQYLEGKLEQPKIESFPSYDYLPSGGVSRFGSELIGTKRFQEFLMRCQSSYDYLIISSDEDILSAQAESLTTLFNQTIVEVTDETLNSLEFYLKFKKSNSPIFILYR